MTKWFCAVASCVNKSVLDKSLSWHRFPKSDENLRNEWIQRCSRSDPINVTNSRICSAHFASDDFKKNLKEELMGITGRRYLKPNAIPTLNLETDESFEKPPVPQTRKRKRLTTMDGQSACTAGSATKVIGKSKRRRKIDEKSYMNEEILFEVDEPFQTNNQYDHSYQKVRRGPEKGVFECSIDLTDDDDISVFTSESIPQHANSDCSKIVVHPDEHSYSASKVSSDCGKIPNPEPKIKISPPSKTMENDYHDVAKDDPSPTEHEAPLEKIQYQHEKLRALLTSEKLFHQANPTPCKTEITPEKLPDSPKLTKPRQVEELFSSNQLKCLKKTKKRIRWTDDEIFEAIKLRFFSLPMYKYLRNEKGYPFPGRLAISRWAKRMKLRGGVLHSVLKIMELGRESSAKAKNHEINNFCVLSLGEMEVKESIEYDEIHDEIIGPFKRMQVMMASSLTGSWRQPVFVDFDCNITKDTVINMIVELCRIGYYVVCFSSDCSDASVKLWNDLGARVDSPSFPHPVRDWQVVVIPDALNAIRLLRDNLLDVGFEIEGSSINRKPLDSLLDLGVCSRLRPYLLQLVGREKHRTDLAVQLVSSTVGTALTQHKPGDAEAATSTGNFLKVMDHWYHLMNVGTSELTVPFRSPYGHQRREQDRLLNLVKSLTASMEFGGKSALKSFQSGIIAACNGLSMLLDEANKHFEVEHVMTQWLNHTAIDGVFSLLSAQFSEVPSPVVAINRFQSYLFGENLDSTSEKHTVFASVARRARIKLDISQPGHVDPFKSIAPDLLTTISSSSKYITDDDLSQHSLNLIAEKINSALSHKYPQLCKSPNLYGRDQSSGCKPTSYFLGNLVKMEKTFVAFTRGLIAAECKNIVSRLTRLMKRFSNSLPHEVIEIFVRLRTEIYARSLVPKLPQLMIKRAMHSKLLMALKGDTE